MKTLIACLTIFVSGPAFASAPQCAQVLTEGSGSRLPDWSRLQQRAADPKILEILRQTPQNSYFRGIRDYEFLAKLDLQELRTFSYDESAVNQFMQTYRDPFRSEGVLPEKDQLSLKNQFQLGARVIVSRLELPSLKPIGVAFSEKEFAHHAKLAGLHLYTRSDVFRYDQRAPSEIQARSGFFPKRGKDEVTVLEHSFGGTQGGAFVSTTKEPGNAQILSEPMFKDHPVTEQIARELSAFGLDVRHIGSVSKVTKAYEYHLKNITGVDAVGPGSQIQNEFITNYVRAEKIVAYREAIYVESTDGFYTKAKILFGRWILMEQKKGANE